MTSGLQFGQPINPNPSIDPNFIPLPIHFSNIFANLFAPTGANGAPDSRTDPMSAYTYLRNKADTIEKAAQQRPMVRLGDKNLNIVAQLTGEMVMEFEELMTDSGQARYVVRFDNWIVDTIINLTRIDEDLHLLIDPIPTQPNWRTRWGGKIHTINVARHEDGTSTVEMLAISHREHSKRLLFAANPIFAPEVQIPKMWLLPGPIRTVLFISCFINLARLFVPGLSFITNIFNPAAWLNPLDFDSLFNFNPLEWPIQVAFVNPVLDQSRWTVLGATWTDWHSATMDMLKDAGVMMRAYTYLTEDDDSPYDELTDLLDLTPLGDFTGDLRPQRNCVIFRFEDWSGHAGPTGTALDGLLNVIGVSLDDLFGSIFINADTIQTLDGEPLVDVNGNNIPILETLLGVQAQPPEVVWREGQFTAVYEATHTLHKGPPKTVMTGGRSPALVNQLQTFGIKWGLSQLSDMINVAIGTMVNTAWQFPATPGLDELYQGQLDNVLFAWERITDPVRALWTGDVAYQEFFERGSATAYTLSGILTLGAARWKTRAFHGAVFKVRNGRPWAIDIDVFLGQRCGFEFEQIIWVDQIYGVKRSVDRKKGLFVDLTIGDGKDKNDPMARTMRAVQAVYTMFGAFLGEGLLFG